MNMFDVLDAASQQDLSEDTALLLSLDDLGPFHEFPSTGIDLSTPSTQMRCCAGYLLQNCTSEPAPWINDAPPLFANPDMDFNQVTSYAFTAESPSASLNMPMTDLSLPELTYSPESMAVTPQRFDLALANFNNEDVLGDIACGVTSPQWSQINDNACVYLL